MCGAKILLQKYSVKHCSGFPACALGIYKGRVLGWKRRWQTAFSVAVSKSTAPKVLSVLAAALEARGACVATDAAASSLTATMTAPDAASEDTNAAKVSASGPDTAEEAAGRNGQSREGTPQEHHHSSVPVDTSQKGSESAGSETGIGRAAKRKKVEGDLAAGEESVRGGADGKCETPLDGELSRRYSVKVRLFQEASNKVAVSASIAGSEPVGHAVHFTETFKAVQMDVTQILS